MSTDSVESEEWYLSLPPGSTTQSYVEEIIDSLADDNGIVNDRNSFSCIHMMEISRKNDAVTYAVPTNEPLIEDSQIQIGKEILGIDDLLQV